MQVVADSQLLFSYNPSILKILLDNSFCEYSFHFATKREHEQEYNSKVKFKKDIESRWLPKIASLSHPSSPL